MGKRYCRAFICKLTVRRQIRHGTILNNVCDPYQTISMSSCEDHSLIMFLKCVRFAKKKKGRSLLIILSKF